MRIQSNVVCMLIAVSLAPATLAQWDTIFTYQGRLNNGGTPANGTYDITVTLWDAGLGGSQIGSANVRNNVPVANGLFILGLDFGADIFDDAGRWLQFNVNGTTLVPRQPLTAAPFSIETRGIEVNETGTFVGIGRSSAITGAEVFGISKNTNSYGGMYVETTGAAGKPFYGYSAGGDVDAYHYLDGASGDWIFVNAVGERMRITDDGRLVVGTSSPTPEGVLHVDSYLNNNVAVYGHSTAPNLTRHGVYGVSDSDNGRGVTGETTATDGDVFGVQGIIHSIEGAGVFGQARAETGDTIGVWGRNFSTDGTGVLGSATADSGTTYGVQGYTASTTGFSFYASGNGIDYGSDSSIRWKKNVTPIPKPLDKLAQIRGVSFDWDAKHGGQHDLGFIGEEVGKVVPEIVAYEDGGEYVSGMDYSRMTPLLVEAVKALRAEKKAEIAALRRTNAALESRIARLELLVQQLTAGERFDEHVLNPPGAVRDAPP